MTVRLLPRFGSTYGSHSERGRFACYPQVKDAKLVTISLSLGVRHTEARRLPTSKSSIGLLCRRDPCFVAGSFVPYCSLVASPSAPAKVLTSRDYAVDL